MATYKKKYYEIGAISKACTIIEKLSTQKSWDLVELCRALNMPKTTIHRMLLTLEDNGYVVQEKARGKYSLSFKLFSIGSQMISHSGLLDIARPFCIQLRDSLDETVNLCILYGHDILVVDKQSTRKSLRQDSLIGSSFSMSKSASGKIFLAFSKENAIKELLIAMENAHTTPEQKCEIKNFFLELQKIKNTGLAYDFEEVFQGVRCIAAPIFDYQNSLIATLSISVPTIRLTDTVVESIKEHITDTTQKISHRMGAVPRSFLA